MSNQWFGAQVVAPEMSTPSLQRTGGAKASLWQPLDPSALSNPTAGVVPRPDTGVVSGATSARLGSHVSAKIVELQRQAQLDPQGISQSTSPTRKDVHAESKGGDRTRSAEQSDSIAQYGNNVSSALNSESFKDERQIVFIEGDKKIQPPSDNTADQTRSESHFKSLHSEYMRSKAVFSRESSGSTQPVSSGNEAQRRDSKQTQDVTAGQPGVKLQPAGGALRTGHSGQMKSVGVDVTKPQKMKLTTQSQNKEQFQPKGGEGSPPQLQNKATFQTKGGEGSPPQPQNTPLHSETIRIQTSQEPAQTLQLTVTVSNVSSSSSSSVQTKPVTQASPEQPPDGGLLPPLMRFHFPRDSSPQSRDNPRRSFVHPSVLTLLATESDSEVQPNTPSRRGSEQLEKFNENRRFSGPINLKENKFKVALDGLQSLESEDDEGDISTEDLEILSLKLEAVTINADYLLTRTREFSGSRAELGDLEEEIERTQRALNDIVIFEHPELVRHISHASRTLSGCKMALEERAPNIETLEVLGDEGRRRSSSVSGGEVRSVALRVLTLNKQVQHEQRRGSLELLDLQLRSAGSEMLDHQLRRGSTDVQDYMLRRGSAEWLEH